MKVVKWFGSTLAYFCIMVIILLIAKKLLGYEASILPGAVGATIGWGIVEFSRSKKKNKE